MRWRDTLHQVDFHRLLQRALGLDEELLVVPDHPGGGLSDR